MRYVVSVKIQLTLCCPRCHGQSIKKNGTKRAMANKITSAKIAVANLLATII